MSNNLKTLSQLEPFYSSLDFVQDYPGKPLPEKQNQNQSGFPGATISGSGISCTIWDAIVVICLGRGADLHMAQLMPLPLTISCPSKSRLVLPFWYRLTRVVLDTVQGP